MSKDARRGAPLRSKDDLWEWVGLLAMLLVSSEMVDGQKPLAGAESTLLKDAPPRRLTPRSRVAAAADGCADACRAGTTAALSLP